MADYTQDSRPGEEEEEEEEIEDSVCNSDVMGHRS